MGEEQRSQDTQIYRFISSEWLFVSDNNMIAVLGLRRVGYLRLVDQISTWINGFNWMRKNYKEFPIKLLDQIRLSRGELTVIQVGNVLKYKFNVTDIQSSDENNIYMINEHQSYHN